MPDSTLNRRSVALRGLGHSPRQLEVPRKVKAKREVETARLRLVASLQNAVYIAFAGSLCSD
jgi:hypothetical protein